MLDTLIQNGLKTRYVTGLVKANAQTHACARYVKSSAYTINTTPFGMLTKDDLS